MASEQQEIRDTNSGLLVGVDPPQPIRTQADWSEVQSEAMGNTPPPPDNGADTSNQSRMLPADEVEAMIARVRQEEKDKLYPRIQSTEEQLKALQREREEREAALRAEQEAAAEAARRREEEEMEVRQLLSRREEEWQSRFQEIEDRYEQDRAVFERERRFQELEKYRQARIEQDAEYIMPELRDLIRGNSEEEIDGSIEEMKSRTAAILGQLMEQSQMTQRSMRGAAPTAPPVGPLEQMQQYESLTPQDIATMDMETYKRNRDRLLDAASRQYRGG